MDFLRHKIALAISAEVDVRKESLCTVELERLAEAQGYIKGLRKAQGIVDEQYAKFITLQA